MREERWRTVYGLATVELVGSKESVVSSQVMEPRYMLFLSRINFQGVVKGVFRLADELLHTRSRHSLFYSCKASLIWYCCCKQSKLWGLVFLILCFCPCSTEDILGVRKAYYAMVSGGCQHTHKSERNSYNNKTCGVVQAVLTAT